MVLGALVLVIAVPGCPRSPSPEPPAPAPEPSPKTAFERLEERLSRTPWRMRFELEAEGAVVASLVGTLSLADEIEHFFEVYKALEKIGFCRPVRPGRPR